MLWVHSLTVQQMHSLHNTDTFTDTLQSDRSAGLLSVKQFHTFIMSSRCTFSHRQMTSTHQVLLTDVIPSHLWKWWMYQISDWMYEPQATLFGPLRKISHRPESIHKVEGKEIKRDMVAWGMRTHLTRFWHRIQPCELKDTSLVSPGYLVRVQWWDLFSASWVFLTIKWNLIGYVILFSCKKKRKKDQIKDGET